MDSVDPVDQLDPDIRAGLMVPFEHLGPDNLGEIRQAIGALALPPGPGHADHVVPGDPPVPVRVHRPSGDETGADGEPMACLFSLHGGGYVIGSYDLDSFMLDDLCPRLGFVGVTVEYRLAPETPYPGPLEDG